MNLVAQACVASLTSLRLVDVFASHNHYGTAFPEAPRGAWPMRLFAPHRDQRIDTSGAASRKKTPRETGKRDDSDRAGERGEVVR